MTNNSMTLDAFRVTNFRSVHDSGWINASDVTALIGTNESGKTNLLIPLWKFNPAKDGDIKLIADAPRKDFNSYRDAEQKPVFITTRFTLSPKLAQQIATLTGAPEAQISVVEVSRDLDGDYDTTFINAAPIKEAEKSEIATPITSALTDIKAMQPVDEADTALQAALLPVLISATKTIASYPDKVTSTQAAAILNQLNKVDLKTATPESTIAPRIRQTLKALQATTKQLGVPGPNENQKALDLILENLPVFVYYSTYGNLDSEIYLPHVIEDMARTDLGSRAEARARTLRVLFDFVRLKPQEILDLGRDHNDANGRPTEEQIAAFAEKKKERSVLLQSASTELTQKFREWWKQGEYRLRFEADGNHFRIWVSDDKRPEEIELEGRSTGLQWFLSFYLIFLVESKAAHNGAVLLLDEPGLSLHPLAQRDLALFFENLSNTNQLLYTTHSPFLIDSNHLDRVRSVYVDSTGCTLASTDLRAGSIAENTKSVYPVHAALGLSVCETLLQGCCPIIVEGTSDQLYLSAIKTHLIGTKKINPPRELVFVPSTGTKGIKAVASILGGAEEDLPAVLCDGDSAGEALLKSLKEGMYASVPDKLLSLNAYAKIQNAEIEDLFPPAFMSPLVDRYLKGPDDKPFEANEKAGAIIPQIVAYAKTHGIELKQGWKYSLAMQVKGRLASAIQKAPSDWTVAETKWQTLFEDFSPVVSEEAEGADAKKTSAGKAK